MTELPVQNGVPGTSPLWRIAQGLGLLLTGVLIAGLVVAPELALDVLWNGAVPVLPAVFLVSAPIWRNVCPLATLNMLTSNRKSAGKLKRRGAAELEIHGGLGILLLLILVPARRFLFNVDGTVLAVTIAAVGVLALLFGLRYARKAGFCNALCPVLPVERLYGQSPMLDVPNPRCQPCTVCTATGCLDRVPDTALTDATEVPGRDRPWLLTPFGAFAVAFPGFVYGYYQVGDVPMSEALAVYGTVGFWMLVSLSGGVALTLVGVRREWTLRVAAAAAIGLYYWFGAATIRTAWELPAFFVPTVRVGALTLIAVWLFGATRRSSAREVRIA